MNNNITWHNHKITKKDREQLTKQKGCILWLTGLSGSGKSTIANAVEELLYQNGNFTYLLDGDNIRFGLNKDLSFSSEDRAENIRRIAEVSRLFVDSGLIVITAFISPFIKDREVSRALVQKGEFIEIFIDTPLDVCEKRDPKGLYKKARNNEIKDFTGISSPYEKPKNPEIHIKTDNLTPLEVANKIFSYLLENRYITKK